MPLVLTQNEVTESGHDYADVLGTTYEFPSRYLGLVEEGEAFVYYRGRRKKGKGNYVPAYLGKGTIGRVQESSTPGRLTCRIEDYVAFAEPVAFRRDDKYLEGSAPPRGRLTGLYFRPGVRRIDELTYRRICASPSAV